MLDAPDLDVSLSPGYNPAPGTAITIIQGSVTGEFNGLPQGSYDTPVAGGPTFLVSYQQGAVLTAVVPTTVQTSELNGITTSVYGQSLTFEATVSDNGGPTPTGTVTFEDGGSVLGTASLDSSGVAGLNTTGLAIGANAITAVYSGNNLFAASTSPVFSETVNQASTTTTLTPTANPSTTGQDVIFTADVAAVAPGGGVPNGSVTFYNGTTALSTATLNAGVAIYSTSSSTLGSYSIKAEYSGNTDYVGSTSPAVTEVVNQAGSTTALTSSANPSVFGQSVTFTAQVSAASPGAGTPTGSVTFDDGTTDLGTTTLTDGEATLTTSDLARGTHLITAAYSGDTTFASSTSTATTQNVSEANTQVTLIPSPAASVLGQSVTLTADVSPAAPASGTPTGSVSFFDGSTELGTVSLNSGTASLNTSSLALGSHSLTAVYGGDGNDFAGSTSSPSIELVGGTTVAVGSSVDPSTFGQSVTLTATVTADAAGSSVPVGSVTFMDGTHSLGTFTLVGSTGAASVSTSALAVGTHAFTAVYGGTADFAGSTSSPFSQVVNQASSSTTAHLSASQTVFGQSVTITATVTSSGGTPGGSVRFTDGNTVLGSASLNAAGIATFSTSELAVGAHSIAANYAGSASYQSSPSASSALTVGQATTSTTVAASTATPAVGQTEVFTATVSAVAPSAGTPAGMVVFHDGSTVIGTASISGGVASLGVVLSSGVGSAQAIDASFEGSTDFAASTSKSQTVTVVQAAPAISLVATPHFVGLKARGVTFTVTVQPGFTGGPVPTGTVVFEIGAKRLRAVALVDGSASVAVSEAKAKGRRFVADYLGDANYKAGVSSRIHIGAKFFRAKPAIV